MTFAAVAVVVVVVAEPLSQRHRRRVDCSQAELVDRTQSACLRLVRMVTAAAAGFLVPGQTVKAYRKHLAAVLEPRAVQKHHFAVWVLALVNALPIGQIQALHLPWVLLADRMPYFDLRPMVDRMLYSAEQVPRADQMLAEVADPRQRFAQRKCFVVD